MESNIKREIAYKIRISDLHISNYVKQDGWLPNYVQLNDNRKVSRVSIIGTVIDTNIDGEFSQDTIILDDGSAGIEIRDFESVYLKKIIKGNIILVIGKVKEYNNIKYILPEIVKVLNDPKWIIYRNLENELFEKQNDVDKKYLDNANTTNNNNNANINTTSEVFNENNSNESNQLNQMEFEEDDLSLNKTKNDYEPKFVNNLSDNKLEENNNVSELKSNEIKTDNSNDEEVTELSEDSIQIKIINFIRKNDTGSGCLIQLIENEFNGSDDILENLLKEGEVFEIKPGVLKVLE